MSEMIEMIPLVGVNIGSKEVCFGDTKEKIVEKLGAPQSIQEGNYYYFNNELRVDFDQQGRATFIEFLAGVDGNIQPQIYGVAAFQTEADSLYELLKSKNSGEGDDTENGYCYSFLNISVGVYREQTPVDVQAMIESAKEEGEPMADEDIQYEMKKANHWDTIGFGVRGYYCGKN